MVLRRNPFSSARSKDAKTGEGSNSNNTPRYYEDYASQRASSMGGSKIELGLRKPKPKLRDDLGFTIIEDDSQENILQGLGEDKREEAGACSSSTVVVVDPVFVPDDKTTDQPRPSAAAAGGIVRTDVVRVSFGEKGERGDESGSRSWDIV